VRRTPSAALAALILILAGCGGPAPSDHGHDHEAAVLRRTVWTAGHELHLEIDAPVTGISAPFRLQVTDLATGAPAGDGSLTLRLDDGEGGGGGFRSAAPVHPGTWEGALTFPSAGRWTLTAELAQPARRAAFEALPVAADAHDAATEDAGDGIVMDKEAQWLLGVRAETAAEAPFRHVLRVTGTVAAPDDRRADLAPPAAGRLAAAAAPFPRPGDRVESGAVLALVLPHAETAAAFAEARAALARAEAERATAAAERTRAETLAQDGAAAARRLEEARAADAAAAARLDAARRAERAFRDAGLRLRDGAVVLELTAPLSGVVTEVHASPGEWVDPSRPVLSLLDPSEVWLRGLVPEADAPLLADRPTAAYRVPGSVGDPIALDDNALISVGVAVDHASRTVPVLYRLRNARALPVGSAVDLFLHTRRGDRGVVLPRSALVETDGRAAVFVQRDGVTFERRLVTVGGRDGARVLLRDGVLPGERVVTASPYSVLLAAEGTSVPAHGHTH